VLVRDDRLTTLSLWLALALARRWPRMTESAQHLRRSPCTSLSDLRAGTINAFPAGVRLGPLSVLGLEGDDRLARLVPRK
jgi:hypothetical protein